MSMKIPKDNEVKAGIYDIWTKEKGREWGPRFQKLEWAIYRELKKSRRHMACKWLPGHPDTRGTEVILPPGPCLSPPICMLNSCEANESILRFPF